MKKLFLTLFAGVAFALLSLGHEPQLFHASTQVELAPESVAGKTITISFKDAEYRTNTDKEYNIIDIKTAPWERVIIPSYKVFTFQSKTRSIRKYLRNREYLEHHIESKEICEVTADYTKLSHNTAKIEMEDQNGTDGDCYIFILNFLASNCGTVTWEQHYGDNEEEGKNAVFYIE